MLAGTFQKWHMLENSIKTSSPLSVLPQHFTPSLQRPYWRHVDIQQKQERKPCQPLAVKRRSLLLASIAGPLLVPQGLLAQELWATSEASTKLPPGYANFARKLTVALREAIEADLSDAEEREVRKKAEPAKDLVKGWISKWKDQQGVQSEVSYSQLSGTIRQLGDFYRQKGQRARLPRALGDELLLNLAAAENALPS